VVSKAVAMPFKLAVMSAIAFARSPD
jgi:hypothetical protein